MFAAGPLKAQEPPGDDEPIQFDEPIQLDEPGAADPPGGGVTQEVPPPPKEPVPSAEELRVDEGLFKEVETAPERVAAEQAYQERLRARNLPRYVKMPEVALSVQALAGAFGAGLVGLLGASVGEAVAPGNSVDPFGGANGPLFGLIAGSTIGSSMGTWASGQAFEKEANVGWHISGASLGGALGAGVAAGVLWGADDGDVGTSIAAISFVGLQVAGALLFGSLGEPPPPGVGELPPVGAE